MARTPVASKAVETAEVTTGNVDTFDPSTVKSVSLGSAAVRNEGGTFIAATSKLSVEGDRLRRLIVMAQACLDNDQKFTINIYPARENSLSAAQSKFYNARGVVNGEYLEEQGIITRTEIFAVGGDSK
jgi:hypothetical protein